MNQLGPDVPASIESLLRSAYAAFNARDIEGALTGMHPDVDWPNGMEGGREVGHAAVRAYWTRQFALIRVRVTPEAFTKQPDGRIAIHVRQETLDADGAIASSGHVRHVYTLREGLVDRMDIETP